MYQYDCARMVDPGDGFDCVENVVMDLTLTAEEEETMLRDGFIIREVSATEYHLIVNRMDVENLQKASDAFWATH